MKKFVAYLFVFFVFINVTYSQEVFISSCPEQSGSRFASANSVSLISTIATIPYLIKKIFDPNTYRRSVDNKNTTQDTVKSQDYGPIVGECKHVNPELLIKYEQRLKDLRIQQEIQESLTNEAYFPRRSQKYTNAIEQIKSGHSQKETVDYGLDSSTQHLLNSHNVDIQKFSKCTGNQLQQLIHQDILKILNAASNKFIQIAADHGNDNLFKNIIVFADVSCDYNKTENVFKASVLNDWCWDALHLLHNIGRCVYAASHGIINGISNTAQVIMHPLQTIEDGVKVVAQSTARLIATFVNIDYHLEHDSPEGHIYFKQLADNVVLFGQELEKQARQATVEGVISHSATIVTELLLQGKIASQVGIFFNNAFNEAQKIVTAAKNELLPAIEVLVATAEGIEVAVAKETIPLLKSEIEFTKWSVKEYDANSFAQYVKL